MFFFKISNFKISTIFKSTFVEKWKSNLLEISWICGWTWGRCKHPQTNSRVTKQFPVKKMKKKNRNNSKGKIIKPHTYYSIHQSSKNQQKHTKLNKFWQMCVLFTKNIAMVYFILLLNNFLCSENFIFVQFYLLLNVNYYGILLENCLFFLTNCIISPPFSI